MNALSFLKPNLRKKLLFFSVVLALIPIGIAGNKLITITQDELKSSANEAISSTVQGLADLVDSWYIDTWKAPLLLMRNAIDNKSLSGGAKQSLLTEGLKNITDIVSLQFTVMGPYEPALMNQEGFAETLKEAGLDPIKILKLSQDKINELLSGEDIFVGDLTYIEDTDSWLVTIVLPLQNKIQGHQATLSARINLSRFIELVDNHPFAKTGDITFIDVEGKKIFDSARPDLKDWDVVSDAIQLLEKGSRAISVQPYARPSGERMLGAYAFPGSFKWGIIVEKNEAEAYLAIRKMEEQLYIWVIIGSVIAMIGAFVFSQRISKPIVHIGKVAHEVGTGDFNIRVNPRKAHDEITDLGSRMNEMIEGLRERFQLTKFVSGETMQAIKRSDHEGVKLGGERKEATVFFSDIRGFTAFSEKVEPEVVIEMLNTYLHAQAKIVKEHDGDIDKFVGDELVAVFQGEDMVLNAAKAAVEIQKTIAELNTKNPGWDIAVGIGINTGPMIMGAMGSEDRMDYTILGDNVNLGARLCSAAGRHINILSEASFKFIEANPKVVFEKLEPIKVKGKVEPINIFSVSDIKS